MCSGGIQKHTKHRANERNTEIMVSLKKERENKNLTMN